MTKLTFWVLAFSLVVGASAYLTLTLIVQSEDSVTVPDLVGKHVVTALQLLTDLGLNTKVKGSEYSSDIPIHHVIFQEPKPGEEVKKDRDVRVILSKGAKTVHTPNLKGLSAAQARIILEENGLCVGEQSETVSPSFQKDEIIAQTPPAGKSVARGSCVDLLLSGGMRPVAYKMPNLGGRTLEETLLLIESLGLRMGGVLTVSQEDRPWNTVVGQEPAPGYRVLEGLRVELSVNRPPGIGGTSGVGELTGVHLFRYRLANGFLKRQVRVRFDSSGGSLELSDDFFKPGQEIWHLIPKRQQASLFLYEDGERVLSRVYNPYGTDPELPVSEFGFPVKEVKPEVE